MWYLLAKFAYYAGSMFQPTNYAPNDAGTIGVGLTTGTYSRRLLAGWAGWIWCLVSCVVMWSFTVHSNVCERLQDYFVSTDRLGIVMVKIVHVCYGWVLHKDCCTLLISVPKVSAALCVASYAFCWCGNMRILGVMILIRITVYTVPDLSNCNTFWVR